MKTLILTALLTLTTTTAMAFENCGDPDEIAAHLDGMSVEEYIDVAMYDESFIIETVDIDTAMYDESFTSN